MITYSVPDGTVYRTKSGNVGGKAGRLTVVVLGNSTIQKGGVVYHIIMYSNRENLEGMYIDKKLLTVVTDEEPDPEPGGPTLTHTIKVYSDGSITVDGNAYP